MKIMSVILACIVFLAGCDRGETRMEHALKIRSCLEKNGCEFSAVITADYGEYTYQFKLNCTVSTRGVIDFTVVEPETICGITGSLSEENGKLTFDDQVLLFPTLSEGLPSPISAPAIFIKSLRSGYICAAGQLESCILIQICDTYEDNSLRLDIITDNDSIPHSAEIYWDEYRSMTMNVENFRYV